jgi:hypothetical protein
MKTPRLVWLVDGVFPGLDPLYDLYKVLNHIEFSLKDYEWLSFASDVSVVMFKSSGLIVPERAGVESMLYLKFIF